MDRVFVPINFWLAWKAVRAGIGAACSARKHINIPGVVVPCIMRQSFRNWRSICIIASSFSYLLSELGRTYLSWYLSWGRICIIDWLYYRLVDIRKAVAAARPRIHIIRLDLVWSGVRLKSFFPVKCEAAQFSCLLRGKTLLIGARCFTILR